MHFRRNATYFSSVVRRHGISPTPLLFLIIAFFGLLFTFQYRESPSKSGTLIPQESIENFVEFESAKIQHVNPLEPSDVKEIVSKKPISDEKKDIKKSSVKDSEFKVEVQPKESYSNSQLKKSGFPDKLNFGAKTEEEADEVELKSEEISKDIKTPYKRKSHLREDSFGSSKSESKVGLEEGSKVNPLQFLMQNVAPKMMSSFNSFQKDAFNSPQQSGAKSDQAAPNPLLHLASVAAPAILGSLSSLDDPDAPNPFAGLLGGEAGGGLGAVVGKAIPALFGAAKGGGMDGESSGGGFGEIVGKALPALLEVAGIGKPVGGLGGGELHKDNIGTNGIENDGKEKKGGAFSEIVGKALPAILGAAGGKLGENGEARDPKASLGSIVSASVPLLMGGLRHLQSHDTDQQADVGPAYVQKKEDVEVSAYVDEEELSTTTTKKPEENQKIVISPFAKSVGALISRTFFDSLPENVEVPHTNKHVTLYEYAFNSVFGNPRDPKQRNSATWKWLRDLSDKYDGKRVNEDQKATDTHEKVTISPGRKKYLKEIKELYGIATGNVLDKNSPVCVKIVSYGGLYNWRKNDLKGSQFVCEDNDVRLPKSKCTSLSVGLHEDLSFEQSIADVGCNVLAVDPKISDVSHSNLMIKFRNVGLGDRDYTLTNKNIKVPFYTFETFCKNYNLMETNINYFKMDYYGMEWSVLRQVLSESSLLLNRIDQMGLTIHLHKALEEPSLYKEYLNILNQLPENGFQLFATSPVLRSSGDQYWDPLLNQTLPLVFNLAYIRI